MSSAGSPNATIQLSLGPRALQRVESLTHKEPGMRQAEVRRYIEDHRRSNHMLAILFGASRGPRPSADGPRMAWVRDRPRTISTSLLLMSPRSPVSRDIRVRFSVRTASSRREGRTSEVRPQKLTLKSREWGGFLGDMSKLVDGCPLFLTENPAKIAKQVPGLRPPVQYRVAEPEYCDRHATACSLVSSLRSPLSICS